MASDPKHSLPSRCRTVFSAFVFMWPSSLCVSQSVCFLFFKDNTHWNRAHPTCDVAVQSLVMSDSLRPHKLQHTRLPCPFPSPGICSDSCPLSQWCHPTISSSVALFSSFPQSFLASGSCPVSQLFSSGGQSIRVSASTLPMHVQGLFPLGLIDLFSLFPRNSQESSLVLMQLHHNQLLRQRPCFQVRPHLECWADLNFRETLQPSSHFIPLSTFTSWDSAIVTASQFSEYVKLFPPFEFLSTLSPECSLPAISSPDWLLHTLTSQFKCHLLWETCPDPPV